MDPCPFIRLTISNLALKLPLAAKSSSSAVHPSSSPCFCKIKLKNFPPQTAAIPYIPLETTQFPEIQTLAATFHLSSSDIKRLASRSIFASKPSLKIFIYTGSAGAACGVNSGGLLAEVSVPLDLAGTQSKPCVFHDGWIAVGKGAGAGKASSAAQFHLNVKAEPDPRFVFQFDGEPECSPQVVQIQGSIPQPVFTCKFSCRNTTGDRTIRSRSLPTETSVPRSWLNSFGSERERPNKERKGWSITVHDLSGSPVAMASIVTPFVASPGTDRVSRSNPGSWLILRPGDGTWKPWGRLEAWRERGGATDGLGYRFELILDGSSGAGIVLAESSISSHRGGKFSIELGSSPTGSGVGRTRSRGGGSGGASPANSPRGGSVQKGFVMAASVEGEGKCSKPCVEVSVQHVSCMEDAAAYVALSAAVDLSMDACRLFNQRMRKELSHHSESLG
ncbi:hypothetical protein HID58_080923 [Brassica napus]|uniref:BnaC08g13920D protein n=3 Tax=Brassica TaxID=3705 RepID=A0A078G5D5_BRANA|nr:PREDICTED: uncharacterized protein LOC106307330 [Brassica oleracea var. oleracea]XP_013703516.1 uncharacterized protein LOC106407229 [Brassica napus]KAH0863712.1 hypothetical protein HID58_080923 [Brassica napus]CAF2108030.1 unnamed protein product [Brassica napus]CDY20666.1 BnaC08g13920D [Brassica napus]